MNPANTTQLPVDSIYVDSIPVEYMYDKIHEQDEAHMNHKANTNLEQQAWEALAFLTATREWQHVCQSVRVVWVHTGRVLLACECVCVFVTWTTFDQGASKQNRSLQHGPEAHHFANITHKKEVHKQRDKFNNRRLHAATWHVDVFSGFGQRRVVPTENLGKGHLN